MLKFAGAFVVAGLLAVCSLGAAERIEIDWSRVIPVDELDHYWRRLPAEMQYLRNTRPSGRVVGGYPATAGQFPYQALLLSDLGNGYSSVCGGTVITSNYILTAAHCVTDDFKNILNGGVAILGAKDRTVYESTQQRISYARANIRVHPAYDVNNILNDIATVRLNAPAVFGSYVKAIALPARSDSRTFAGFEGTVSGFGRTSDAPGSSISSVLMYTRNPVMSQAQCNLQWSTSQVLAQHVCFDPAGGRATCNGDSGGPLAVQDAGRSLQVGITSFGAAVGCAAGYPSVFVRISYYRDWIAQNSDYVFGA
ncbi:AGAP006674-PA-like protein [Anopheles sinensis]|uniref:AGAP006674-PA-like protein n=1 Tax=Anopheles sinensis TaxID=74873 RepID=A0A084WA67_ANOSI|nr:AGAP006674-PA-like protein [Anopheles sinensis]